VTPPLRTHRPARGEDGDYPLWRTDKIGAPHGHQMAADSPSKRRLITCACGCETCALWHGWPLLCARAARCDAEANALYRGGL